MQDLKDQFVAYFSRISPLSSEEAEAIAQSMEVEILKKGAVLLKEGQKSNDTYFVLKGCVREYILQDGEEKTTNFFTENQWMISMNNFHPENRSAHYWVCLEETTLVHGNEVKAQKLFEQFPRFETISRAIMEAEFAQQKAALTTYFTHTPEQRYLQLMETRPDLLQRVPQYHLASYIGVKPESLSRIRKRISSK